MPFITHPFPKASQWAEEHLSDVEHATFLEYRYAVDYHLGQAERANQSCASSIRLQPDQIGIDHTGEWIYPMGFSADHVVRFGDTAIREAVSALDAGLQVSNYILGSKGVTAKKNVLWKIPPDNKSPDKCLHAALAALPHGLGSNLTATLDKIFSSIGYTLLRDYRNWVTHRGAPRIVVSGELAEGRFRMPVGALMASDARSQQWHIETHLLTTVPKQVQVQCWPFVPPVQAEFSGFVEDAKEDIDIAGFIHIGKGSKNITIENNRMTTGSLLEDAASFRAKNPILLEKQQVRAAGEDLVVYAASDYIHAVAFIVLLAEEALTGEWDLNLRDLWEQIQMLAHMT